MSTEARRTLVVDLDWLERYRDDLRLRAKRYSDSRTPLLAQADGIDTAIHQGTTVNMDPDKVAGMAQVLAKLDEGPECLADEIREHPWQARERAQERFYSEAHAVDADWSPAAATVVDRIADTGTDADWTPAGGAA